MNSQYDSFTSIADTLLQSPTKLEITDESWMNWQNQWLFDKLVGKRCGQSFCDFYGLGNHKPLYHFRCDTFSMKWIMERYRSEV